VIKTGRVLLLLGCWAGTPASAETLAWFNDPGTTSQVSSGAAMDGGFSFELGVFSGGFQPTAVNTAEWLSYWQAADTTAFNPGTQRIAAQFEVSDNTAPFTVGSAAWIFGRRDTATGSEWILLRKSTWTWPAPNPFNPFTVDWNIKDADIVVLGQVNGSGTPFLMKSAPVFSWAQWQTAQLTGEPLNGPNQDPDGDGVASAIEFVMGTTPLSAVSKAVPAATLVDIAGSKYLQMTVPRLTNRHATLVVEVSSDLVTWTSGPAHTVVVSNTLGSLVVRDLTAYAPPLTKRFIRLRATVSP
jgi:hypothetical protein